MQQYHDILSYTLTHGKLRNTRSGNTYSGFGYQTRFNLTDGFPLVTSKKIDFKNVVIELLWFLRGETNIRFLVERGVNIWNDDAYRYYKSYFLDGDSYLSKKEFVQHVKLGTRISEKNYTFGDMGKIYGYQWRKLKVDQINNIINLVKSNPHDRGIILSSWNVNDIDSMALRPCHTLCQFYVSDNTLSCQLYQRSADLFLGVPYNIASYSLLIHIIAKICGLSVGEYVHTFGDFHIYENHIPQVNKQLARDIPQLPTIELLFDDIDLNSSTDEIIDSLTIDNFNLINYNPHSRIRAKLSVGMD